MRAPPNPGQLRGSGGGQGGASSLVTLRLFQTMSKHPLCNVFGYHNFYEAQSLEFGYFLYFRGGYFAPFGPNIHTYFGENDPEVET